MNFDTVPSERIQAGDATDAYFLRTEDALDYADKNPTVVAEVSADQFGDGKYEIFAGVNNVVELLEGLPITVEAIPEGSWFDGGPVIRITGKYRDFARYETALLGFISHASGMATNAAKVVETADADTSVLSFGARHIHPSIGPVLERSAYISGCGGYSFVAADETLPEPPTGTMPHALIIAFGHMNQAQALTAFDESASEDVPRIALCDTFTDEVEEVRLAVETLGDNLDGVRLDTTGSRRGDFVDIIREVRWELQSMGRDDVDIYVSGGIGPDSIAKLNPHVDGIGVGSFISNANPVDFGLDIVQIDGEAISKRGKLSGVKEVSMETIIDDGEVVSEQTVETARAEYMRQRDMLDEENDDIVSLIDNS